VCEQKSYDVKKDTTWDGKDRFTVTERGTGCLLAALFLAGAVAAVLAAGTAFACL